MFVYNGNYLFFCEIVLLYNLLSNWVCKVGLGLVMFLVIG